MDWKTVLSIALPVLLGALVWMGRYLIERSWSHYEVKREAYVEVVRLIDSLFESGDGTARSEYLRAVRKVWLVGSDDVVRALGNLTNGIKHRVTDDERSKRYSKAIMEMRKDLNRRVYLPPAKTELGQEDFPVEGPGRSRS